MATPYTGSWVAKKFTLRTYILLIIAPILVFSVLNIFYLSNLETLGAVNRVCVTGRGGPLSYPDYFGFYSTLNQNFSTDPGYYCGQYTLKIFSSPAALYIAVAESVLAASLLMIAFFLLLHWIFTRSTQQTGQPIDPNNLTTRQGVQTALYVGVIIGGFIILYVAIFILSGFLK